MPCLRHEQKHKFIIGNVQLMHKLKRSLKQKHVILSFSTYPFIYIHHARTTISDFLYIKCISVTIKTLITSTQSNVLPVSRQLLNFFLKTLPNPQSCDQAN